jgi:hypothetical protein
MITSQRPANSGRPVWMAARHYQQISRQRRDSLNQGNNRRIQQQHTTNRSQEVKKTYLIQSTTPSKLRPRAANLKFSPLPQLPPQHLPNRALGDLINERDTTPQLLIIRQPFFHKQLHFFLGQIPLLDRNDIRTRPVGRRVVGSRHADHSGFFDARVCEEEVLELGGGDL